VFEINFSYIILSYTLIPFCNRGRWAAKSELGLADGHAEAGREGEDAASPKPS
jgi:hypothetical protein